MNEPKTTFVPHPGVRDSCPVCKGLSYVVGREGEQAVARLCDCVGACPVCRDTGFVAAGPERRAPRVRCRCEVVRSRIRRFDEARLPARHAVSTRSSFQPSKASMSAFVAVSKYLTDYAPGGQNRGLILHGDVGRGKTHLLVAMVRELIFDFGVTARFVEFSHLIADLKGSFEQRQGARELVDPLVKVEVLAIDELGKGRNTEFEGTVLDELISRRYNAAATILATTNYGPGSPTGRGTPNLAEPSERPALADRVGDRVYSRLREMCDLVPLKGEDYRVTRGRVPR